ncbi:MAG: hypothetical protein ACLSXD_07055 [Lawsonibacter sp.]|jgi:hypothetical protein
MTEAGKISLKLEKKEGIMLRNAGEKQAGFPGKDPGGLPENRREYE